MNGMSIKATNRGLAEQLWSFMLQVYSRPGIAQSCLALQDRYGVDIPLFLSALYACLDGRRVDRAAVSTLDRACADWRRHVILPLRQIRRRMKGPDLLGTHPHAPDLRERIKAAELQAERVEADMHATLIADLPAETDWDRGLEARLIDTAKLVLKLGDSSDPDRLPAEAIVVIKTCMNDDAGWGRPQR